MRDRFPSQAESLYEVTVGQLGASGHLSRRLPLFLQDWGGLQGTGEDNELANNSLPVPNFTTKVAHRRHFSKRVA